MLKLQGFHLTGISPKNRCWSPCVLFVGNPSRKVLGLQGACGLAHRSCAIQEWLGKADWVQLEAKGDSSKWTWRFESGSNIKHKCAFQVPATRLRGWLCGMMLVHLRCSLPCVTALPSFTLIIYNHKMKSQERRKMSWFSQSASVTGIVCNFKHMLNCFAGSGSNFLGRYCKNFWEHSWKEETKTFPL